MKLLLSFFLTHHIPKPNYQSIVRTRVLAFHTNPLFLSKSQETDNKPQDKYNLDSLESKLTRDVQSIKKNQTNKNTNHNTYNNEKHTKTANGMKQRINDLMQQNDIMNEEILSSIPYNVDTNGYNNDKNKDIDNINNDIVKLIKINKPSTINPFLGLTVHKNKIYLTPFSSTKIGVVNVENEECEMVDMNIEEKGIKFWGSCVYDDNIYYAPSDIDTIGKLNTQTHEFSTIDISKHVSGIRKFQGCVVVSDKIYFIPSDAPIIGCLDTLTNQFFTLSLGKLGQGLWKFCGGVLHNNKVYMAPSGSQSIGVLDTNNNKFTTIQLPDLLNCGSFCDPLVIHNKLYLTPTRGDKIVVYDLEKDDLTTIDVNIDIIWKFSGSVHYNKYIVYSPWDSNYIGVLNTETHKFGKIELEEDSCNKNMWHGGVRMGEKMFWSPHGGNNIGVVELEEVVKKSEV